MQVMKDFVTKCGLRAVVYRVPLGHLCGYVEIKEGHPLFGIEYNKSSDALQIIADEISNDKRPLGEKGIVNQFLMAMRGNAKPTPDECLEVHGGVTFSGPGTSGYPVESDGWWFGFDCAHAGDTQSYWTVDRVSEECESLADQLSLF
jgi:hypothetical protein